MARLKRHGGAWVIAGGGTGGHVAMALALAEELQSLDEPVVLFGTRRGIEATWVPSTGFELVRLPAAPLVGRGAWGSTRALAAAAVSTVSALRALARARARIVVSVGGYAAVPALAAGLLSRRPLALVEPNAVAGRTHRVAARWAERVFLAFEEARGGFAASRIDSRARVVGAPIRRAVRDAAARIPRPASRPPFTLLVLGGSQGARALNEAMIAALPELGRLPLRVMHQTGRADRDRVARAYARAGVAAEVFDFDPDLGTRYRRVHFALCRAGALTVAELACCAVPALLVPYPHAADRHQHANAAALVAAGAARMLEPRELDSDQLVREIRRLIEAPAELERMSQVAARLARPDAARAIIEECRELVRD